MKAPKDISGRQSLAISIRQGRWLFISAHQQFFLWGCAVEALIVLVNTINISSIKPVFKAALVQAVGLSSYRIKVHIMRVLHAESFVNQESPAA